MTKKLLEEAGIAALVMDREDSGAYLRIIGLGSPFGMDVYVNRMYEDQAKQLIQEAFSQKEDLSDRELEELARASWVSRSSRLRRAISFCSSEA